MTCRQSSKQNSGTAPNPPAGGSRGAGGWVVLRRPEVPLVGAGVTGDWALLAGCVTGDWALLAGCVTGDWALLAGCGRCRRGLGAPGRLWAVSPGTGRSWPAVGGVTGDWALLAGCGRCHRGPGAPGRLWAVSPGTGRSWPAVSPGTGRSWPAVGGVTGDWALLAGCVTGDWALLADRGPGAPGRLCHRGLGAPGRLWAVSPGTGRSWPAVGGVTGTGRSWPAVGGVTGDWALMAGYVTGDWTLLAGCGRCHRGAAFRPRLCRRQLEKSCSTQGPTARRYRRHKIGRSVSLQPKPDHPQPTGDGTYRTESKALA